MQEMQKVQMMTTVSLLLFHLFVSLSSAQTLRGQFNASPLKSKRINTVMSAATAAIFVGQSGAGKSTLINKIRGVSEAKVSHSKLIDGTEKIQLYGGTAHTGFAKCCDTPGLLSNEHKQGLYAYVRKGNMGKILIVLVINKNVNRITNYVSEFEDLLADLVPKKQKFAAVWVGKNDALSPNDRNDFQKKFPQAMQFDIQQDNYRHLSIMLKDPNSYCDPLCRPMKSVPLSRPTKPVAVIPTIVAKRIPIGLPKLFNKADSFSTTSALPPPRLQKVVRKVIEFKMNSASSKYRTLKLMGDAYLKPLVYQHILRENKYVDNMEDKALCVLSNKADSAMPRFFDSHVRLLHDEMIPNEKGLISLHGKSDVIEAILEHCRLELETEVLKFLISTLFKSIK